MEKYQQQIWTIEEWFYECKKHNLEIVLQDGSCLLREYDTIYSLNAYKVGEQKISFQFTSVKEKKHGQITIKKPLEANLGFNSEHNFYYLKIENYSELEYLGYSFKEDSKNDDFKDDNDEIIARGLYYDTVLWLYFNM